MKQFIKELTIQIYKVLTYLVPVDKRIIIFQSSNVGTGSRISLHLVFL